VDLDDALVYAAKHELLALIVVRDGHVEAEVYGPGWDGAKPHPLYSGAKSFWGVAAVAAQSDGLLDLDETVGATFPAWHEDPWRRHVTLRMLLQMTAGVGFGGLGNAVPTYDAALQTVLKREPLTAFTYSGIPLQIFGAVFARKLAASGRTPHDYLRERILDPIGMIIGSWRELADGTNPMPTGAFVAAREWLKYGALIVGGGMFHGKRVIPADALAECFLPTAIATRYGLGWWLGGPKGSPPDIAYASGAAGQALYVIPSRNLVVVHFSKSTSWDHNAFLRRLLVQHDTALGRGFGF
jgi:CubicO group peptidase (beta-lactamase class C family)